MLKNIDKKLLLILVVAILLRIIGITHGFPFIFHFDEPSVVRSALGLRFDLNPGHFDWPHLYFYLNYILYFLFIKFRAVVQVLNLRDVAESAFPLMWRDPLVFYWLSRVFSALLGAFTIIPVFLTAKYLFNYRAGLFAALILTFLPFHIWTSHFALLDVPTAFWISWALYFSARLLYERNFHYYILAGLFIGLAASTKYNGGLVVLLVPIAHVLRVFHNAEEKLIDKEGIQMLVYSGLFALFGFLVGTPFALFDYGTFSISDSPKGAYWQFSNVGKVDFVTQLHQFITVMLEQLSDDFGYTILIAYFASVFFLFDVVVNAFVENKKKGVSHTVLKLILLLVPSLFIFFYISGFEKTRSHYFIITYPFVVVVAGFVVNAVVEYFEKRKKTLKSITPFLFVFFILPVVLSISNVLTLSRDDTRVVLYEWILENIEPSDHLYYGSSTFLPVVDKFSSYPKTKFGGNIDVLKEAGYLIMGYDNDDREITLGVSDKYKQVKVIRSSLRNGPNIVIFKI